MIAKVSESSRLQSLSAEELRTIEGGLSLSGLWDAVKSAANRVVDVITHILTCPCNHFPGRL